MNTFDTERIILIGENPKNIQICALDSLFFLY